MYFPDDMTFQYFFFDTYIGFFLQVLPIALLAGAVFGLVKSRREATPKIGETVLSSLFVCYMTGLVCLVLLLDVVKDTWYLILYHHNVYDLLRFFTFDYDFALDFWNHLDGESIGNVIMFCPFGILYPLAHTKSRFADTVGRGAVCVFAIELLQPVFGRAFDINDVILDLLGIAASAAVFFAVKNFIKRKRSE